MKRPTGKGYRSQNRNDNHKGYTLLGVAFIAIISASIGTITYILTTSDVIIIPRVEEINDEPLP